MEDIAILTVRPRTPIAYLPGQALPVRVDARAGLFRWYCPANAPRPDATIELHVRAVPRGRVSGPLVHDVRPGHVLRLGPPAGSALTLDPASCRDLLLIASGTGLAPLRALAGQLAAQRSVRRQVTLVVGARTIPELYDASVLYDLARAHPWLRLIAAVSDDPYALPGERGTPADVACERGPWPDHEVYVCGSDAMVRDTVRRLLAAGTPPERLHVPDQFTAGVPRRHITGTGRGFTGTLACCATTVEPT